MNYLINTVAITQEFPLWIIPLVVVYLIGAIIAFKGVNKRKKWWEKALFVILWPYYFTAIMIQLLIAFG